MKLMKGIKRKQIFASAAHGYWYCLPWQPNAHLSTCCAWPWSREQISRTQFCLGSAVRWGLTRSRTCACRTASGSSRHSIAGGWSHYSLEEMSRLGSSAFFGGRLVESGKRRVVLRPWRHRARSSRLPRAWPSTLVSALHSASPCQPIECIYV